MKSKLKNGDGFTLIEIMLVVAIIVAIGSISVPVYQSFQVKNNMDVAAYTITQTLRRAQVLSQAGVGDSAWGVHIASGSATLFRGASFGVNHDYDEISNISTNITPSGVADVVYSKILGEPQSTGIITLTTTNNNTTNIIINAKGTIEY